MYVFETLGGVFNIFKHSQTTKPPAELSKNKLKTMKPTPRCLEPFLLDALSHSDQQAASHLLAEPENHKESKLGARYTGKQIATQVWSREFKCIPDLYNV